MAKTTIYVNDPVDDNKHLNNNKYNISPYRTICKSPSKRGASNFSSKSSNYMRDIRPK